MMRNIWTLFFAVVFISGCNSGSMVSKKDSSRDSARYANLIMNVVMNNINYLIPDYGKEATLIFADNYYYGYKANKVVHGAYKKDSINGFTGYKEIDDNDLGLTLRIHRWTCGCEVSLPNTILYVSNTKDFEYAFVLTDESKIVNYDTLNDKPHLAGPPSLEFQLNFLTNALRINSLQSAKSVERFFTLIADSLLCLKRLNNKDIDELQKEKLKFYDENEKMPGLAGCAKTIDDGMGRMLSEIKTGADTILYCRSSTKYYPGFWRFGFSVKEGRIFINAVFNKCICGKLHV